jgi:hypothetical protein
MIRDDVRPPKIIHSKAPMYRRKFGAIMNTFKTRVMAGADQFLGPQAFEPTTDNLLNYRTQLVKTIKAGMLEKKDMEVEIATLAAIVWFLRLSADERSSITGLW